jgi:hypothetical protein
MPVPDDYPVAINEDGIKIKTEKMEQEKLYHCIFEDRVYLFYKDELGLLHCYEVENPDVVKEIAKHPKDLEEILRKHADV